MFHEHYGSIRSKLRALYCDVALLAYGPSMVQCYRNLVGNMMPVTVDFVLYSFVAQINATQLQRIVLIELCQGICLYIGTNFLKLSWW